MYDVEAIAHEPLLLEPLRRSVEQGAVPAYLRSLKIKITARCNLKCLMCRYGQAWAPPELETSSWSRVLREASQAGCRKVHFSGGEVLLRRDFEELVACAADAGLKITLTSNLTLLTKDRARGLFRSKISAISTSLDGATAKVHDRIRGVPGSFVRTLRALSYWARFRKHGQPRLRINFVMMRENFRDYPDLIRLAGELGAMDVVPMPVDTRQERLRLTPRLIREYNQEVAPQVLALRQALGMPTAENLIYPFGLSKVQLKLSGEGEYASGYYAEHLCYAPFLHAFIAWDGNVYLCCMTNGRIDPLGNVDRQSLSEIFSGDPFQRIRQQMLQARLPSCHSCDMMIAENRVLHAALTGELPLHLANQERMR